MDDLLAVICLYYSTARTDTLHTRIFIRTSAIVAQYEAVMHTVPRVLKRLSNARSVEHGRPFLADRKLRTDIALPEEEFRNVPILACRYNSLLVIDRSLIDH